MAKTFSSELLAWYEINKRDLPWRKTKDPYKIWISEIMLQQTTVAAVIPFFERWIKSYPTMGELASASEESVMKSWEGLGYYSRVRNIHKAAKIMVADHGGCIPDDPAKLIKLPGFGPYTVGALLSIAYGQKQPIIDANVRRIVMRQRAIRGRADASIDPKIMPWVEKNLPDSQMSAFNQAFMELGALICRREAQCLRCPVSDSCKAHAKGIQDEIPTPKKVNYVDLDMVAVVMEQRGAYLIKKRTGKGVLNGLWEFPALECRGDESKRVSAGRVLQVMGFDRSEAELIKLTRVRHYYTNHRVKLHPYHCRVSGEGNIGEDYQWVALDEIRDLPMHSGAVKITELLMH